MAVRRRQVRQLGGKRLLIALVIVCLAAAGLCAYLLRPRAYQTPSPAEDTSVLFSDRASADVARLLIRNGQGEAYEITQRDGQAAMDGDAGFDFSTSMLDDALRDAAQVYAQRVILDLKDSDGLTAADFGITDASIAVTAVYTDGAELTFHIGDLLPEETPAYYMMIAGDTRVFATDQEAHDVFSRSRMALHAVPDPAIKGDLIDAIAFAGDTPFRIERRAGDEWYLTAPFEYPLSSTAVESLLDKLENLRFAQYVAPESAGLSAYGLDAPRRVITLDIAASILTGYDDNGQAYAQTQLDAYQLTLACGADASEVIYYCLYRGDVLKASYFTAGFLLSQGYDGLLLGAPINVPTNRLTSLTLTRAGETHVYALSLHERVQANNQFETDENGNILYDVQVTRDGEACDATQFLYAYGQMTELAATSPLPAGYAPTGDPAMVLTLAWEDGARELAFYPYDALHWAVAVNGVALFYVDSSWADGIALP